MIDGFFDRLARVFDAIERFLTNKNIPRPIRVIIAGTLIMTFFTIFMVCGLGVLLALSYAIVYGFPWIMEHYAWAVLIGAIASMIILLGNTAVGE